MSARAEKMRRWTVFVPFLSFLVLAALFWSHLTDAERDQTALPSPLLGRPVPAFTVQPLEGLTAQGMPLPAFSTADLKGKVSIVNVFASWCIPCAEEHPFLMKLAEDKRFSLFGLNYKDRPEHALAFLQKHGNPYSRVGSDPRGRAGIDFGVYGVPETFVIAADGIITYKHIGPLTPASMQEKLLPALDEARKRARE